MVTRIHESEQGEKKKENRQEVEYYFWIHAAFRKYVEVILDLILMGLVLITFILIGKTIFLLGESLYETTNISFVISEIMFIFILIETIRLLIIYLEFHRVAIDTMVEITIVSILREIILKGILHIEPLVLTVAGFFILVLGFLLRYGSIRQEKELFSVYKPFLVKKGRRGG